MMKCLEGMIVFLLLFDINKSILLGSKQTNSEENHFANGGQERLG